MLTHRALGGLALGLAVSAALSGCSGGEAEVLDRSSVNVPVHPKGRHETYVLKTSARVSNDEFINGDLGYVVVQARSAGRHPKSDLTPLLTALVKSRSGKPDVKCTVKRFRDTQDERPDPFWADFTHYMSLSLQCTEALELGDVSHVVVGE